jgi:sRNA-binding protein
MMTLFTKPTRMIDAKPTIVLLCEKFPAAFFMFEQRRKPLALGIHKEVALAMPALTAEQIKAAMRFYVSNEFYCRACREGAPRINLLGHEAGVVTAAEADNAVARIAGIKEWRKKKKAAAKEAAARAKAEVLAAAKAAEIEAARPVPKGINASRPTLHLKVSSVT